MIEAHFGLQRTPFARDLPAESLFRSQQHQELAGRLRYVAERQKFLVLLGEVGVGKSTALRQLAAQLDATRYEVVYLADVAFTPSSFYMQLLAGLRQEPPTWLAHAKRLAKQTLLETYRRHQRTPLLLVDEAQSLSHAVLEEVRGLTGAEFDSMTPFALVLSGTPRLAQQLALRVYEPLTQRIDLRFFLQGLTEQETAGYVRHHLRVAGAKNELFTDEALTHIHRFTAGLPRRINQLATVCLMAAASRKHALIDDALVADVLATELEWPTEGK